jgi:hypothetical protein
VQRNGMSDHRIIGPASAATGWKRDAHETRDSVLQLVIRMEKFTVFFPN